MDALKTLKQGHSNIQKMYFSIIALAVAVGLLSLTNIYLISVASSVKPLVIRVSEVGNAEAVNPSSSSTPASSIECKYLSGKIATNLFGFSRLTFEEDIKRILPYVSYELKDTLVAKYKTMAQQYIQSNTDIKIEVFAVVILSDNGSIVQTRTDYVKTAAFAGRGEKFYAVFWFKRIERSINNPFGLELISFQEHRYLKTGGEE